MARPLKEPPADEVAMEVEEYSPPWTARERVVLDNKEKYFETDESIHAEASELEHYLLGPEDVDFSIRSPAENAMEE